jgi:arginyl-tRNA synthetase
MWPALRHRIFPPWKHRKTSHLIKALARYPEAVETAGTLMEPHRITYYLMTLAAAFHTYYNRHRVLCVKMISS